MMRRIMQHSCAFLEACKNAARKTELAMLTKLTDDEVSAIGRCIVKAYAEGCVMEALGKATDNFPGQMHGACQKHSMLEIIKEAGVKADLTFDGDLSEPLAQLAALDKLAKEAKEAENTGEDVGEEDVPTKECQPMFPAEEGGAQ